MYATFDNVEKLGKYAKYVSKLLYPQLRFVNQENYSWKNEIHYQQTCIVCNNVSQCWKVRQTCKKCYFELLYLQLSFKFKRLPVMSQLWQLQVHSVHSDLGQFNDTKHKQMTSSCRAVHHSRDILTNLRRPHPTAKRIYILWQKVMQFWKILHLSYWCCDCYI